MGINKKTLRALRLLCGLGGYLVLASGAVAAGGCIGQCEWPVDGTRCQCEPIPRPDCEMEPCLVYDPDYSCFECRNTQEPCWGDEVPDVNCRCKPKCDPPAPSPLPACNDWNSDTCNLEPLTNDGSFQSGEQKKVVTPSLSFSGEIVKQGASATAEITAPGGVGGSCCVGGSSADAAASGSPTYTWSGDTKGSTSGASVTLDTTKASKDSGDTKTVSITYTQDYKCGGSTATVKADGEKKYLVGKLELEEKKKSVMWYPGGEFDAAALLTDDSGPKDMLKWTAVAVGGGTKIDEKTGKVTFGTTHGKFTFKAEFDGNSSITPVQLELIVVRFNVKMAKGYVCDGEPVKVKLELEPSDADKSALDELSGLEYKSELPKGVKSYGNPSDKTELGFENMKDASSYYEAEIKKPLWYANESNQCNKTSIHEITAKGKVKNVEVEQLTKSKLDVDAGGGCVNGEATIGPEHFAGDLKYTAVQVGKNKFECRVEQGTFRRNVVSNYTTAPTRPQSQFLEEVEIEEKYHANNQSSNPEHAIMGQYWLAKNVMDAVIKKEPYKGKTSDEAIKAAQDAFENAKEEEDKKYVKASEAKLFHCPLEKEAKDHTKTAVGRDTLYTGEYVKCAYKECAGAK